MRRRADAGAESSSVPAWDQRGVPALEMRVRAELETLTEGAAPAGEAMRQPGAVEVVAVVAPADADAVMRGDAGMPVPAADVVMAPTGAGVVLVEGAASPLHACPVDEGGEAVEPARLREVAPPRSIISR